MADQKNDQLYAMRHSLAHIMATAITTIWPEAKLGVGPVVEDGFYYDVDIPNVTISTEDFPKIEKEMRTIISDNQAFIRSEMPIDDAIVWAKESKQPYKVELLNDLKREGTTLANELTQSMMGVPVLPTGVSGASNAKASVADVSFYTNGEFTDLCRGPHLSSTGGAGVFKLMRVAGAYWRGDENNPQMQRVYGVSFEAQQDLDKYLVMQEEAKKRDHRKLGKELDLFTISPLVGSGLPLFTGRGTILRELLNNYSQQLRKQVGYESVWTPHIAKKELYEKSGHWAKFGDEWLTVHSKESHDELVMKPMNCPHHQQIYASKPRSYRDLPLRYMETTTDYRDEKAGELVGLSRVRSLTQDDSHTFCTPEQIKSVMGAFVGMVQEFYVEINLPLKVRLSFRDESDAYLGDADLWDSAQATIREVVEEAGIEYYEGVGEAAFYGPKIDFMAKDALGRELQLATPQLDFVQPARFGLSYTDKDGSDKTPVMIHFAMLGSIERFLAAYIEHTAGWFPFWLAPEQVRILTINDSVADYVAQITSIIDHCLLMKPVKYNEVRYSIDDRNESLGKKIKEATAMKIPLQIIVGPKDRDASQVSVRMQDGEQKIALAELEKFLLSL